MHVALVPYTRLCGSHALLLSVDGGSTDACGWASPSLGEDAVETAVSGLLTRLHGTMAEALEGTSLRAKLAAGRGVHEVRLEEADRRLILVPTPHEQPPHDLGVRWIGAAELLQRVDDDSDGDGNSDDGDDGYGGGEAEGDGAAGADAPPPLSRALSSLLAAQNGQRLLRKLAAPVKSAPRTAAAEEVAAAETAAAEAAAQADQSVPRRLATDLFVGGLASASNEPLLRMLGTTHVVLLLGDAAPGGDEGEIGARPGVAGALSAARALDATLIVVPDAEGCVLRGESRHLLAECLGAIEAGLADGGALIAGPLCGAGAAWVSCAHLASGREPCTVRQAFLRCRALFPSCRMSASLAAEAGAFERATAGADVGVAGKLSPGGGRHTRWLWPPPDGVAPAAAVSTASPAPMTPAADSLAPATAGLRLDGAPKAGPPASAPAPPAPAEASERPLVWYRCAKCRTTLFSEAMLETHEPGDGQASFKWSKRTASAAPTECTSLFLQCDSAASLTQVEGKLGCPKCGARLGSYNWSGAQCSCGAWVTPALQVVKSKVDAAAPTRLANLLKR